MSKFVLKEKHPQAGDAVTFVFESDGKSVWTAGQYTVLHLDIPGAEPDEAKHYFTISSAPYEQFPAITTRITESKFKQTLNNLPMGSVVEAENIRGSFTVPDDAGHLIFIAGGIGITPFRSILLDRAHRNLSLDVNLLYANRDQNVVFRSELENLTKNHSEFKINYVFSPERIDDTKIKELVADYTKQTFYVSGPEPMVEAIQQMLAKMGVPEPQIKHDAFPGYKEI